MIRLVLFDIDGTLLRGRDMANLEGWLCGLELGLGLAGAHPDDVPHVGFTDRATALAVARSHGRSPEECLHRLPEFFAVKDRILAERVSADPAAARLEATVGANDLLARLRAEGVILGLVTGNSPAAAFSKLMRAGLDPNFFVVGGYGDACATREELVSRAMANAAPLLPDLRPEEVAVIGDTAADVASARAWGNRAVAVLGGRGDRDTLAGCDALLEDLTPTLALAAIMGVSFADDH